ncbi:ABC transporter substrate-binding protein [Cumulibacter soli]|uniref:ABC transporter substrate-binding protein n=1 Tax=Cumulibacter soli TaxID=2546344 RepID=UPI0014199183|nr:ABC transporter substrate-binding protein [Cumulibacter soli]
MRNLGKRLGAVAIAALLALLTACGSGGSGGDSDTLRIAVSADISSLDPIKGNSGLDHVMLYTIYDTLISFDAEMQPQPGLAEAWELVSPTELRLDLRTGVKFHDGTDFDAEAVKYNLERGRGEGSNVAADLSSISEVEVTDPQTVTIKLSDPDASILMVLADRAGMMVSPTAAKAGEDDVSANPIGTGGWEYVDWKRGEALKVKRFADYWDSEAVRVENIDFNVLTDPTTRVTSLKSGQQDLALAIAASDAATVEAASGVELFQAPSMLLNIVFLNTSSEELSDPNVRRALSLAINRDSLLSGAFFDRGTPAAGIVPEDYWATPPSSVKADFDPDKAKSLLAEAGVSDLQFDIITNADSATVRTAEVLQQQWENVGVTVNLMPRELVQATNDFFVDKLAQGYLSVWTGRPDPAMTYRSLFTEDSFYNAGAGTPGMSDALAASDESLEPEKRKPGLDGAAESVFENTSALPLAFSDLLIGHSDDVTGLTSNLLGKPKLIGVTIG